MPALLPTLSLFLGTALAHSHLAHIIINGNLYHGFDPRPNQVNPADRVGWFAANTDDGFVTPAQYNTPEIVCHLSGSPPVAHAPVKAGDRIHVQWNGWPMSHVGPILSYVAPCTGTQNGCAGVTKTNLRWTKIDDSRPVFVPPSAAAPASWATDLLIARNNSWQVQIPSNLKPGPYVLRHEIIALHFAADANGAQNYPLCMNLYVEPPATPAANTFKLDSIDARSFYKPTDKGILFDPYQTTHTTYVVPGPTVAVGATPVPHAQQVMSVSRADGTPVVVTRGTQTVKFTSGVTVATAAPKIKGREVVREE
ncbi:glycosyl hydrolase family 61-domain-containing protein [Podospora australis]|uniref:lytic cellulose monooxygenase (C4-dehydrogenating) n=1 Tax=Podospora australis TaxID=1536484 RepID=A0AAN6WUV7_9PEZI|nr:glycosyl hydrolase family 61-domain-containing protein [Podospora australis]